MYDEHFGDHVHDLSIMLNHFERSKIKLAAVALKLTTRRMEELGQAEMMDDESEGDD